MYNEMNITESSMFKSASEYYFSDIRKLYKNRGNNIDSKDLAKDYENAKIELWSNYIFSSENVKRSFANFLEYIDKPVRSSEYDEVKFKNFVKQFNKLTDSEKCIDEDVILTLISIDVDKVLQNKAIEFCAYEGSEFLNNVKKYLRNVEYYRDKLVENNLLLVAKIAKHYSKKFRHVSLDDLIAEGNMGLFAAAEHYSWRTGYSFSTYATYWIKYYITRNVANKYYHIRIPVGLQEVANKMRKIIDIEGLNGNAEVNLDELAKKLNVTPGRAKAAFELLTINTFSLNASANTDNNNASKAELIDLFEDANAIIASDALYYNKLFNVFKNAFDNLDPMEKFILEKRFNLDGDGEYTLAQIGEMKNLSRERIRQIEERAKNKLKKRIAFHFGEDALNE